LIEAFHGLRLPRAELWLVGPVAPEMEAFRRRYESPSIVFHGPRPQAELGRWYGRCAVFCLASLEEGMAMVVPQAIACGLPVIATRNSGAEEIVREGVEGHLVPVRDVEALRRRILELYEDPERRRAMGRAALARVRAGFTWDEYGDRVVAAYRALLARRGSAVAPAGGGAGADRGAGSPLARWLRTVQPLRARQVAGQLSRRLAPLWERPESFARRPAPAWPGVAWAPRAGLLAPTPARAAAALPGEGSF